MTNPPRPTCHVCLCSTEGPVPNGRSGGFFWLCRTCDLTWNLDGTCNKDPQVAAPASSRRGRCLSRRMQLLVALVKRNSLTQDEATEFLDAFGVPEVERLLKTG